MSPTRTPELDAIRLTHGQARWVLWHADLWHGGEEATFDTYLKSLRRDGVPFAPDEIGVGAGFNLEYRFEHLMELALALALRSQSLLSRDIVRLMASQRKELRRMFRRAWHERGSGLGQPVNFAAEGKGAIMGAGVWLDLRIFVQPNGVIASYGPKLLGPVEAVRDFLGRRVMLRPTSAVQISDLAEDIVRLAGEAPEIRRGRRS